MHRSLSAVCLAVCCALASLARAHGNESVDEEIAQVKELMATGEFRQALSYANLTAGENPRRVDALVLPPFLEDRTGRTELSLAKIAALERTHPNDWLPVAVHAEILVDRLAPAQAVEIIERWTRTHSGKVPPELMSQLTRAHELQESATGVGNAGNGIVIEGGKAILLSSETLSAGTHEVIVRNGLGQTRRAQGHVRKLTGALARLELREALPTKWSVPLEQVAAPEGARFCFVLGFSVPNSAEPAYPAISPGLVFRADAGIGGLIQITSALGPQHNGAPVFDARGRLIGLALSSADHSIDGKSLRERAGNGQFAVRVDDVLTGKRLGAPDSRVRQPPMPSVEELYERLAPAVVQVISSSR